MDTQAGKKNLQGEIGQEQDEQDFAALEMEEGESEGMPGKSDQQEPKKITSAAVLDGTHEEFEGIEKEEGGEEEERKACPTLQGQPSSRNGELEPTGDEKMQEETGERGAKEQIERNAELRIGGTEVESEEDQAGDEEKAGEVIAFKEVKKAEGQPMVKEKNNGNGNDDDFKDSAPTRGGGRSGRIGLRFFADHVAKERAANEENAEEPNERTSKNLPERQAGGLRERENLGGPGLGIPCHGGGKKHADVSIPWNDGELDIGNVGLSGEVRGVVNKAGRLELPHEDAGIGDEARHAMEEEIFGGDTASGLHGSGRNSDDTGGAELFGDAKSDGAPHGVAGKDGAVRNNHAASSKATDERSGAGFCAFGSEGTGRMSVAGEIRDIDAQAKLGETAREVLHDEAVGGNSVEEDDGAGFGSLGRVGELNKKDVHAAGCSIDDIAFLRVTARRMKGEQDAQEEEKNSGTGLAHVFG